jgi:hypothetical protein
VAQVFPRYTNTLSRVTAVAAFALAVSLLWLWARIQRSPYTSEVRIAKEQPVPFSHRHHAGEIGIDCRYCHTSVEESAFAGIPPSATCMNCHKQIWAEAPMLASVRESVQKDQPLEWVRVHDLPDFAYFNHSVHVKKGMGCETCHGRVDQMPLMLQESSLQMEWCLECHREPEKYVRPRSAIYTMGYEPRDPETGEPTTQAELGPRLVKEYGINGRTSCSTCHR